jgi:hypothetical protein
MKFTIYIILLPLFLTSCYQQERNCSDYKTGKFEFTQEIDGKKQTTIFERNDSLQIETYNGKTDTASVRWINDCEFILQKKHPKSMSEKKAISMRILTTSKNGYLFEYGFVNDDKKQRGSVTKIQ